MGQLLAAFAYASDLAFGLEMDDCLRSCYVAVRLAEQLQYTKDERRAAYYATLIKDAGCTCFTSALAGFVQADEILARREGLIFTDMSDARAMQAWLRGYVATGLPEPQRQAAFTHVVTNLEPVFREGWYAACEVSARIAGRLKMTRLVQEALLAMFEFWNGSGLPNGLAGEAIPRVSRLMLASFFFVPYHRRGGRQAAMAMVERQRGVAFEPAVCDALAALAASDSFWRDLEGPIAATVLALEPEDVDSAPSEERFDDIAYAFADFVDLKSPYTAAHSRRVAVIAERIAGLLGRPPEEQRFIRRAALMHDLGLVAVPTFYLNKADDALSVKERETVRLHPYHGERILSAVSAMHAYVPAVGAHHERFDGQGYFRGLRGKDIPLAARIVAVADRLDDLTHEHPARPAARIDEAIETLIASSGREYDPDVVFAIAGRLGALSPELPRQWPAGLTSREVEVLRLASAGLTRDEIAANLGISANTVRHHLTHIYEKTGATTRVGATLFAMEHGLLP